LRDISILLKGLGDAGGLKNIILIFEELIPMLFKRHHLEKQSRRICSLVAATCSF
jgi:hypothetical protein